MPFSWPKVFSKKTDKTLSESSDARTDKSTNISKIGCKRAKKKRMATEPTKVSLSDNLEENIFAEIPTECKEDEELVQTPPPSPSSAEKKDDKSSIFSLAKVQDKLYGLWSDARQRLYGEDYWIPSDAYEVAVFPNEYLKNHKVVYPTADSKENILDTSLSVVQCTRKKEQPEMIILNHVVYDRSGLVMESLSLFRAEDLNEAMDFCRRCEECRALFKLIGEFSSDIPDLKKYKDIRRHIRDVTSKFKEHPLWRMVHIAIACSRLDVFTDEGLEYLRKMGYTENDLTKTVSHPEGKYPIMLAIETNQPEIVKYLLKIGADIKVRDLEGNNCMHYAALASTQMIEIVWSSEEGKELLNGLNNDRYTPALLAIRNANPFCLKLLLNIGADLSIRIGGKNALFEAVQSKGKTIDIIRALLEAQPDLITEVEEATGNTVLHAALYKMPLMGVLNLRREELNLNAVNKAGQTALHLYTSRGDIGMIITLSSYGCDMNVQDCSGNTPLHIAVSKNYLVVTRLLLCLGSEPNVKNFHGESPRHMASKLNDHDLLKSLIMCDAKRCEAGKSGCVSGCVHEKGLQMLSKSSAPSDNSMIKPSPRSYAAIEELETRQEMVQEHSWNKFHEIEHLEIYDEMIQRLTKMVEQKEQNKNIINVLTFDGGGIKGLIICQILLEIEKVLGEPILQYFDWVAGTSTGALVAAAMSLGKTPRACQMVYLRFKDLVFDGWVRPYKSYILEAFIKAEMGDETLMSDLKTPRLMFTTTRADIFPVQLEFMRNYQLPLSEEENVEYGYGNPKDLLLWKALRRTSAAPTFFSSVDGKYIDGGIISNNPTLDLLAEIQTWNTTCKYLNLPNKVEIGCVLSIGTGVIPNIPMDAANLDITFNPYSSAMAISKLGVILVDQVTATEGAPVNRASAWCITQRRPYFRLSAPLHTEIKMDEKDDLVLAKAMWDCVSYSYRQYPYIVKLCDLLRKIGKAETRRHLFENIPHRTSSASVPPSPI